MKVYTKPQMLTLSISANDMLCSGCTTKLKESSFADLLLQYFDTNKNGRLEGNELFTKDDDCTSGDILEQYCKYTFEDRSLLVWS